MFGLYEMPKEYWLTIDGQMIAVRHIKRIELSAVGADIHMTEGDVITVANGAETFDELRKALGLKKPAPTVVVHEAGGTDG